MLCLTALIIFAVLGIFSATHRQLAREAFECVVNRARRLPCEASMGERVKTGVVGWLVGRNLTLARFFNRYAEVLAWVFVILSIASALYVGRGVYNLLRYGACDPSNPEGCIFKFGDLNENLDTIERQLREGIFQ